MALSSMTGCVAQAVDAAAAFGGGIASAIDRVIAWCLAFVDEFFDTRRIRGVDLCLCLIAAGWVWAVSNNPDVMGRLAYAGLSFVTQQALIGIFALLTAGHLIGFLNPEARTFRVIVLMLAGWIWVVIGSFMTWAVTTGGVTYLVAGFVAVIAAIHLERGRA